MKPGASDGYYAAMSSIVAADAETRSAQITGRYAAMASAVNSISQSVVQGMQAAAAYELQSRKLQMDQEVAHYQIEAAKEGMRLAGLKAESDAVTAKLHNQALQLDINRRETEEAIGPAVYKLTTGMPGIIAEMNQQDPLTAQKTLDAFMATLKKETLDPLELKRPGSTAAFMSHSGVQMQLQGANSVAANKMASVQYRDKLGNTYSLQQVKSVFSDPDASEADKANAAIAVMETPGGNMLPSIVSDARKALDLASVSQDSYVRDLVKDHFIRREMPDLWKGYEQRAGMSPDQAPQLKQNMYDTYDQFKSDRLSKESGSLERLVQQTMRDNGVDRATAAAWLRKTPGALDRPEEVLGEKAPTPSSGNDGAIKASEDKANAAWGDIPVVRTERKRDEEDNSPFVTSVLKGDIEAAAKKLIGAGTPSFTPAGVGSLLVPGVAIAHASSFLSGWALRAGKLFAGPAARSQIDKETSVEMAVGAAALTRAAIESQANEMLNAAPDKAASAVDKFQDYVQPGAGGKITGVKTVDSWYSDFARAYPAAVVDPRAVRRQLEADGVSLVPDGFDPALHIPLGSLGKAGQLISRYRLADGSAEKSVLGYVLRMKEANPSQSVAQILQAGVTAGRGGAAPGEVILVRNPSGRDESMRGRFRPLSSGTTPATPAQGGQAALPPAP